MADNLQEFMALAKQWETAETGDLYDDEILGECAFALRKVIRKVRERDSSRGWQPIETAPKDGTTVIVGTENDLYGFVMGYGSYESHAGIEGWVCKGFTDPPGELGLGHPTHWMPLPTPPKTDDSGD